MSKITFLIGVPCSGKTTYRENNLPDVHVVSRDDIREKYIQKENISYKELFTSKDDPKIDLINKMIVNDYKQQIEKAQEIIKNDGHVVVDLANLLTKQERVDVFKEIVGDKYKANKDFIVKEFIVFEADKNVLLERNEKRGNETGKEIPFAVIEKMIEKYEPVSYLEDGIIIKVKDKKKPTTKYKV